MITEKNDLSLLDDPVALAMAVLMERIRRLSKEDREDLYDLSKAVFLAETAEEERSASTAMREILEQTGGATRHVEPIAEPGDELKSWVEWVSEKIKTLRKQAGMTQVQLAEKSGIPQSHISRLENGEHSPSFLTLEKIASALGVPVSELDPSA